MSFSEKPTIYCIGRNYRKHAEELGNAVPEEPVVFLKAASALRGLQQSEMAFADETFHFEAELVLKIGRKVPLGMKAGWDDVSEVAIGIDLTRRGVQDELKKKGLPWTTAKSFKGSAIVGPFVGVREIGDLNRILFTFEVNGVERQRGDTSLMIFPVPVVLSYLASMNDLEVGDLVFTGTPEGVGEMRRGDRFSLKMVENERRFSGVL